VLFYRELTVVGDYKYPRNSNSTYLKLPKYDVRGQQSLQALIEELPGMTARHELEALTMLTTRNIQRVLGRANLLGDFENVEAVLRAFFGYTGFPVASVPQV